MTTLPDGQRCTLCRPPVTAPGTISVTIRIPSKTVHRVRDPDFGDLMRQAANRPDEHSDADTELVALYQAQDWPAFFALAVKAKKTIAATGSTGSGKTSLLRRLMQEIPGDERLVTIEDTDEFGPLPLRNRVSMFYGSANVSAEDAVEASLRMRPDRVAMQELRGAEAFAYLRLLAAGHPGGLTTWHAEEGDPFTPLALMAKTSEAGRNIPDDKLLAILRNLIDIVAFCRRDTHKFLAPSVYYRAAEAVQIGRRPSGPASKSSLPPIGSIMPRVMLRPLALILAAVSAAGLWLVSASALWSKGTGTPFTPLAWWDATQWWLANWWVNLWLVLAAAVPTFFLAMLLLGMFQVWRLRYRGRRRLTARLGGAVRAIERGVTDNHGHTQWRSMADARKLFPGPHKLYGGMVVGEAYRVDQDRKVAGMPFNPRDERTWGMGGKAPLLIDPCTEGSGHSLIFVGPGGFKTTSAVSTVLTRIGSSVILDPSIELGPMLDGALRRQRKQVVHIGIPGEDETLPPATGFNVLGWIDITHPEAELHVGSVVSRIYDEAAAAGSGRGEDPFFAPMGRALVTCLLAHLV